MEERSGEKRRLNVELELSMALLRIDIMSSTQETMRMLCSQLQDRIRRLETRVLYREEPAMATAPGGRRAPTKRAQRKRR